ncbi:hypothetical protein ACJIZ3_005680 [Penstemon smallii]|uniref:Uncharacterized protein n=1 Tax=Penstemon smallii TaxID=265156 RepID=A0ABD3S5T4_9LAMI
MGRGKIEIKKIENVNSRQVTFSKRRNGLMKKAKELSVLCDAQIAVLIFSSTGKFYEFASSRMEQILAKYNQNNGSPENAVIDNATNKQESTVEVKVLKDELEKLQLMHRRMTGKELDGLTCNELDNLEQQISEGILSVKDRKEKILLGELEISKLQEKKVVQQNAALREQIEELRHHVKTSQEKNLFTSKDSCISSSSMLKCRSTYKEGTSDISLRLGLSPSVDLCCKRKVLKKETTNDDKNHMIVD